MIVDIFMEPEIITTKRKYVIKFPYYFINLAVR